MEDFSFMKSHATLCFPEFYQRSSFASIITTIFWIASILVLYLAIFICLTIKISTERVYRIKDFIDHVCLF
jgi:hypothetical protein